METLDQYIQYQLINYLAVINRKCVFIRAVIYDNIGPINVLIHKSVKNKHKKIYALPLKYNLHAIYPNLCDGARTIYYISEEDKQNELLTQQILPYTTNITKFMLDLDFIDAAIIRYSIEQDFMYQIGPKIYEIPQMTLNIVYDFGGPDLYLFNHAAKAYLNNQEYDDVPDVLLLTGWKRIE